MSQTKSRLADVPISPATTNLVCIFLRFAGISICLTRACAISALLVIHIAQVPIATPVDQKRLSAMIPWPVGLLPSLDYAGSTSLQYPGIQVELYAGQDVELVLQRGAIAIVFGHIRLVG